MAIDWGAFESGLVGDIEAACAAESWEAFASQLAVAIRARMETVFMAARVAFAVGTIQGDAPPPPYHMYNGYGSDGTIG